MARCLREVERSARRSVALRVESSNAAAVGLYLSLGFRPYAGPGS
jgi:ribosomal protein S18 acetylase RimI-like enzyme